MNGADLHKRILDNLNDGVYMTDADRRVSYWNRGAQRITGFTSEEVVGSHCWDNILQHVDGEGQSLCTNGCALSKTLIEGSSHEMEVYLHHKEGHRVPVRLWVSPILDDTGAVVGAVEVFTDNFASRQAEERIAELERMAYLDTLTGVANRRFAEIQIRVSLDEMDRYGWSFGLILLDINRFKEINDRHGHLVGDRVLKTVAATLTGSSRPFDTVSRWGGDEFLIIVKRVTREQVAKIAEKYEKLVSTSGPEGEGGSIRVSASAGFTMAQFSDTPQSLLARADDRMYSRKSRVPVTPGTLSSVRG